MARAIEDIKQDIIKKIQTTSNLKFLERLDRLFSAQDQNIFQLSETQSNYIAKGEKELDRGEGVNNEDAFADLEQWLNIK
tara:strand:- start:62172 stop:62411 length:240 start_codon:yes stop_codon:yes gene_type:complete